MSQLIGNTPKVDVLCTAIFIEGADKIEVPFNAIFTRLSRKANKALKQKMQDAMRTLRGFAKEIVILEQDTACLSDNGKVILADERYLKTLNLNQSPKYLTDDEKAKHRDELSKKIDMVNESIFAEVREGLQNIKNFTNIKNEPIPYCPELVDEMLDNEGYFTALREGFFASTGAFEENRTKN